MNNVNLKPGDTLPNGACIIEIKRRAVGDSKIVLAHMPGRTQPFVTWECIRFDSSCHWGHYFSVLDEALADFNKR
jgi:hypothetical protein